jgi:U3 small nucleolar RNA-associated protein 13
MTIQKIYFRKKNIRKVCSGVELDCDHSVTEEEQNCCVRMLATSFRPKTTIEPFYTGGEVSIVGNLMASCASDMVMVTDLCSGERLASIEGDGEVITSLAIAPSGTHLVTCSRSLQMHIYQLPEATRIKSIKAHESPVMVMTIDPTSTLIATGGAEGAVKVWDLRGGYATHNLRGHGGIISALKFWGTKGSMDWKLASGSDDTKVRVWDLFKSKCVAVLDNHVSMVRGLDFSSDGKILISGGRDKVVSVWDSKFKLLNTIPVLETLETVGFIKDTKTFYAAGEQGIIRIRTLKGELVSEQIRQVVESDQVGVLNVQQTSSSLYSILSDQMILELGTNLELKRQIPGNHGEVIDCCFLSDTRLAIATNTPEVRILNLDKRLECDVLVGHTDIVISIDRTYDGNWLATAGKDNQARLWHCEDGLFSLHSLYSGHAGSIGAVALPRTPDTTTTTIPEFLITGSQDLTIKRWSPRTQQAVYTRKAHDKDINAIDVSPDDRMFATASQDRTAKIWNVDTGEVIGVLRGHKRGIWSVRFSQWDKTVATGSGDKTVKLWNLNDYSCIRTFEGHTNSVLKVGFLNQAKQLVSAGGDGLVKVWDTSSGECNATLDNHQDKVWCVSVDEEGAIISGGGDGIINVWQDVSEEERSRKAEEQAELVEKQQELENYVRNKNWPKAFGLALSLNHPMRLLKLLTEIREYKEPQSITGLLEVDRIIGDLENDDLVRLIKRLRDWNTNARTSTIAQGGLYAILKYHSVEKLQQIPGITAIIDSLIPYSDRHYTRVDDLLTDSAIVEYALREMAV